MSERILSWASGDSKHLYIYIYQDQLDGFVRSTIYVYAPTYAPTLYRRIVFILFKYYTSCVVQRLYAKFNLRLEFNNNNVHIIILTITISTWNGCCFFFFIQRYSILSDSIIYRITIYQNIILSNLPIWHVIRPQKCCDIFLLINKKKEKSVFGIYFLKSQFSYLFPTTRYALAADGTVMGRWFANEYNIFKRKIVYLSLSNPHSQKSPYEVTNR